MIAVSTEYDGGIEAAGQPTYQQQGMNVINPLFCVDNLDVLRNEIPDESVDLIYLDLDAIRRRATP